MHTIILEGIATSGKSTIIKMLESVLSKNLAVKVVPESETTMAIIDNTDRKVAISHLRLVIEEAYETPSDYIIFDRLHLTHAFRVNGAIKDFYVIENMLMSYNPLTVFLEVNEAAIAKRVQLASQHRDPEWKSYILTKGETFTEIAEYYINQQRNQKKLLVDSKIPYKIYNTSSHDYEAIVQDILTVVQAA